MSYPAFTGTRRIDPHTVALESYAELPGLGLLPVNAYLLQAREPVLVDTGMAVLRDEFMQALRSLIDPTALRWIWITHADADHIGGLRAVLEAAPNARIVTNYLGAGKLNLQQFPVERTYLLNPGQALDVGDRRLRAFRPPVFDAPETMGLHDSRSGFAFTSDCFGAVMERPADSAMAIAPAALQRGAALWAGIDAPWLPQVDSERWPAMLNPLRSLVPTLLLGTHLPPAAGLDEALYRALDTARGSEPFVGPDQATLEAALAAAMAGHVEEETAPA
jgi:hypothetical protein